MVAKDAAFSGVRRRAKHWVSAAALILLGTLRAHAGEVDGFEGGLRSTSSGSTTYTWGLEYREPLGGHFSAGVSWLNEGHLPTTHRDGQALQLLWHSTADAHGLAVEGGIGPYRYYDTHSLDDEPSFEDKHGWGVLATGSVDWYFANQWFSFLRVNETLVTSKYGTTGIATGIGYRFAPEFAVGSDSNEGDDSGSRRPRWEIDGLIGERIGNTDHSESGVSEALGVRFRLSEHFTVSATNIAGQGTLLGWRDGFAFQLWLDERVTQRFRVAVGAGGFLVSSDDSLHDASDPSNLASMVSVSVAYSLNSRWTARAIWDRIGTGDDHDADIVQIGVGYSL